ncbi:MAG: maleylpyruvate isomerase family mycothiol-dependent enzyme [Sporichthyaceae bacterium]|nr:maleylpyruvate isomerase family mycothiol-dependent enzyme [Sporichthyaceae bacterium]
MTIPVVQATAALDAAYRRITEVVEPLDGADLLKPSRCAGWAVGDLLAHLRMDAERALVGFATPAAGPADLDLVTYWSNWTAGFDAELGIAHARFVRIIASAYARPAGLVAHWRDTAEAAVRAARVAAPDGYIRTQDHVLSVADFVATLVVEATVHHLDLVADLADAVPPSTEGLQLTRRTIIGLADLAGLPDLPIDRLGWDDATAVLKTTGRLELTEDERAALGQPAARLPLIR